MTDVVLDTIWVSGRAAHSEAADRAAARIAVHQEVEGDMCFPGQPDAEAWVQRARQAEAMLAVYRAGEKK